MRTAIPDRESPAAGRRGTWAVLGAIALMLTGGCGEQPAASLRPRRGERILVAIVPGAFGNAGFWPTIQPGKASFASELAAVLGPGCEVYPPLWDSSLDHAQRSEAAKSLAATLDKRAAEFDRVCLVGHSHGGNIALLAAGLCRTARIDMLICLATPHIHLDSRKPEGTRLLPVYCSPQTLENTRTIVTISPTTDKMNMWLSLLNLKGVTQSEAIDLAAAWREREGHPRLARDSLLTWILLMDNVVVSDRLNVASLHVPLHSLVYDRLPLLDIEIGRKAHQTVHSRRMGRLLGELIRDGVTPQRVRYMTSVIQPNDADDGAPIDSADNDRWQLANRARFDRAGWRLQNAALDVSPSAGAAHPPALVLRIYSADKSELWGRTEPAPAGWKAAWSPGIFVYEGADFVLGVYDGTLRFATCFGERLLKAGENMPCQFSADPAKKFHWSGNLHWEPMHY